MRVVCINLDRSADRWRSIQEQTAALGLPVERLPAVDGVALAHPSDSPVPPGAMGCFLSHQILWHQIDERSDDYTLVLEDDALLSPDLPRFLGDLSWIPDDADIVHIGATDRRCFVQGFGYPARDRSLYRSARCTGTEAYIISRRCAGFLARDLKSIGQEFDQILFGGGRPELKIYKLLPALCIQDRASLAGVIERPRSSAEAAAALRRKRKFAHLRLRLFGWKRLTRRKAVSYQ